MHRIVQTFHQLYPLTTWMQRSNIPSVPFPNMFAWTRRRLSEKEWPTIGKGLWLLLKHVLTRLRRKRKGTPLRLSRRTHSILPRQRLGQTNPANHYDRPCLECSRPQGPPSIPKLPASRARILPNFMFISETRIGLNYVNMLKMKLNFHNCFHAPLVGLKGGLILFWSDYMLGKFNSYIPGSIRDDI